MNTTTVLNEVAEEREYQNTKWGQDFDDSNSFEAWNTYLTHYSSRHLVGDIASKFNADFINAFRDDMVKVAAIAVAAVESIDRYKEFANV